MTPDDCTVEALLDHLSKLPAETREELTAVERRLRGNWQALNCAARRCAVISDGYGLANAPLERDLVEHASGLFERNER